MKDTSNELIDIINILLHNDGRQLLKYEEVFPLENVVNENVLVDNIKGYISYVRGENPITFPDQLELSDKNIKVMKYYEYIDPPLNQTNMNWFRTDIEQ